MPSANILRSHESAVKLGGVVADGWSGGSLSVGVPPAVRTKNVYAEHLDDGSRHQRSAVDALRSDSSVLGASTARSKRSTSSVRRTRSRRRPRWPTLRAARVPVGQGEERHRLVTCFGEQGEVGGSARRCPPRRTPRVLRRRSSRGGPRPRRRRRPAVRDDRVDLGLRVAVGLPRRLQAPRGRPRRSPRSPSASGRTSLEQRVRRAVQGAPRSRRAADVGEPLARRLEEEVDAVRAVERDLRKVLLEDGRDGPERRERDEG